MTNAIFKVSLWIHNGRCFSLARFYSQQSILRRHTIFNNQTMVYNGIDCILCFCLFNYVSATDSVARSYRMSRPRQIRSASGLPHGHYHRRFRCSSRLLPQHATMFFQPEWHPRSLTFALTFLSVDAYSPEDRNRWPLNPMQRIRGEEYHDASQLNY